MGQEEQILIDVRGMDCPSCAVGIETSLRRLGVLSPSINVATGTLALPVSQQISTEQILEEIERLGYSATIAGQFPKIGEERSNLWVKVLICTVFTTPLFLAMFLPQSQLRSLLHQGQIQLLLTLPVLAIGLHHFGRSALRSIKARLPNMDLLILIGVLASFGYSLAALLLNLGHDYLFFETTATITTLVLIGNYLEQRSMRKASAAIEELSHIQAQTAKRVDKVDGAERIQTIQINQVRIGDLLRVNTGDRVPVDGKIIFGSGALDESIITGESVPVTGEVGASVTGGTILVSGSVTIQATAIGDKTVLAQIIALVHAAQSDKPSIQRMGDIVSAYFTPLAVVISLLTFILTYLLTAHGVGVALLRAVAVLVIACPCAMGLATPTAVMIAIGRAAKSGLLIRGGSALERLARVKTVVFDKTGTLTAGFFKIRSFSSFGIDETRAKAVIKALEQSSSHPIAQSIVREFSQIPAAELVNVTEINGSGISGVDKDGKQYRFGSPRLSQSEHAEADLVLIENDSVVAALTIEDELRDDAKETILQLKALGIKTILLSGDTFKKCAYVAEKLSIDKFYSAQSPSDKLNVIAELQQSAPLAFVGDGINDAPALSKASVGISLSDATQVAIQSADIILLKGKISRLVKSFALAQATLKTIKQNLFWAFSYNIVALPVAALGYLSPTIAAFAMGFSDVMAIGNSLRLRNRNIMPRNSYRK